jgi:hypothetical protein
MNTQLVQLSGQKAFTTSLIVSKNCDNRSHESTIKLIRKYQSDFEEFGKLDFKSDLNTQGSATEYADLTEDQATYLITLFRNTPKVREFKIKLVKAFRKAIDEINRLYANPPRNEILSGKRKAHDPMMNALTDWRSELGKDTNQNHFMCENKLCNSIITGKYTAIDEKTLSNQDADLLQQVRVMNENLLKAGIDYNERKAMLQKFGIRHRTKFLTLDKGE